MRAGARRAAREPAALVATALSAATFPASAAGPAGVGRYRPVRRLTSNASVEVWEARGDNGCRYALKRPVPGARPAVAAALECEWQRGTGLDHAAIVRPVDWLDSGPTIVFDYLSGGDLAALAGGPVECWARPLLDLLAALDYLHRRGLVHRDVKARNVLLDRQDRGHLIDLGSCLPAGSRWRAGGTTPIQRPEVTPERVSTSDDLIAVAALVDEMLTPDRNASAPVHAEDCARLASLAAEARRPPAASVAEKLRGFALVLESVLCRTSFPHRL